MDRIFRITEIKNNYYRKIGWVLKIYLIKSRVEERITDTEIDRIINQKLVELEEKYMSNEFNYFRVGFAFLHYGNRGIDLSIWHMGKWGDTYELFMCSWYCYGRSIDKMEWLDSAEPVLSQYEMKYLFDEMKCCADVIQEIESVEKFRKIYIEKLCKGAMNTV